jgi:peptidoglycan/LPS O-acetylase OafA/YrhL
MQRFVAPHPRMALSILAYLQFFLIGFLLVDIFLVDWKESPARSIYWDLVALVGWPLLILILNSKVLSRWFFPGLIFVLYCAAFRGKFVNRIFRDPWITAIGGMCYSIYLLHDTIISAVGRITRGVSAGAPYSLHLFVQLILIGSIILVISSLYFVLIEKPCMRRDWVQRLWGRVQSMWMPKPQVAESKAAD